MAQQKLRVLELERSWVSRASVVWTDLLQSSDANAVFMSWAWISSWLETLGDKSDARILGLFEGDRPVAIFPLCANRSVVSMGGKRLSLAGVEQAGADYSDLLCIRGYEDVVVAAVAEWLSSSDDWSHCEFSDVLPTALVRRVAALMAAGNVMEDCAGSVCPRTSLSNGWQGILRDRFERKHRYNIERQIRLAEERQGLRLVFHDTPETIARAFPILVKLHNERKAAQGVKSAFSQPDRLAFHLRAAVKLSDVGRGAFVVTLESQRSVVSAAYCFRDSKSLYYFQSGISSSGSALGAGSTLLYMLLRWAANQGFGWFDFLKGDESYKRAWATDRVQQRTIRITRPTLRGRSVLGLSATRRALASAYRMTVGGKGKA